VGAQLLLRQSLQQVQELNTTLEERVAQRTAELELALQSLQQSQENLASSEAKATLSTLVASVSHELSTPLGNSLMAVSTLSDHAKDFQALVDGGSLKRSDLANFLEMLGSGIGMVSLNLQRANQLLGNFRQVAADQASEQRRVFDLAHTVQEIVHTLSPGLKRHPHRIVQNIPAGITLDSQPGPLGQVVINLINNAYLHAFENRNDGVLTISASEAQDTVTLHFADNGVGIPAEHLEKLFQPFFSTKIGKGGTGLGMAIVNNLVTKALGGRVTVTSTPGQGAEFQVELPKNPTS
jgi:signal transduction histidine kinase